MTLEAAGGSALIQGYPGMRGQSDCDRGEDDCNTCVTRVEAAFSSLRSHGDVLGFHIGAHPDPTSFHHWQGVQRLVPGGARHLLVSRNGIPGYGDSWSGFAIVQMGSRNALGERYRSNRLHPEHDQLASPPPAADVVVHTVRIDSTLTHAGGIQAMGSAVAVPVEREGEPNGPSAVYFFDVGDPSGPPRRTGPVLRRSGTAAGTASLARLADGRLLLAVGGWSARPVDLYVSRDVFTGLDALELLHLDRVEKATLEQGTWGAYQSLNFVTECDTGRLYLIGLYHSAGEDRAHLHAFENDALGTARIRLSNAKRLLTSLWGGDVGSSPRPSLTQANAKAAGGVYIDPSGGLFLYVTEHDNDGPYEPTRFSATRGSVKFMEFRPVPHSACSRLQDAWVELYEHDGFRGRSLMIDYADRDLKDYSDYSRVESFGDAASSARWCIPAKSAFRVYEHATYRGASVELRGTGKPEGIENLHERGLGKRISSSRWEP
jgi:hypothetical protein